MTVFEEDADISERRYSILDYRSRVFIDFLTDPALSGIYHRPIDWEPVRFLGEGGTFAMRV